ncbi:hypothetical protein [Olivibacter sp. XZL3]|uniref:hypothetical protein n=1 Tax=Olivibacter sp. XZL3 TaxID=1735116 RepID=UPI0010662035|nr:hypothetical protein [Olivibacter sp. XZL3]
MQKTSRKRVIAIARESIEVYRNKKRLILLLIGVFIGGGVIYTFLTSHTFYKNGREVPQFTTSKSALLLLEDSLSATNSLLLQLNRTIDRQMQTEKKTVGLPQESPVNLISNTNKRLIIKKIEAILRYLKTPLNQFNQLPAYFINNAALEQQIRSYNDELANLQKTYREKSPYDVSYFKPLERLRDDLIAKLESEKKGLLKANKKRQPKRARVEQPSEKLLAMLNKRDSIVETYSGQLERYQKKLSQTQVNDLMDSLATPQVQRAEFSAFNRVFLQGNVYKPLLNTFLLILLLGMIPFFVIFFRKYKSPFIERFEDLEMLDPAKNSQVELNKNVNRELIAFNYEQLIKAVGHLAADGHSLLTCYSAGADSEQSAISLQLGSLLAKLGNDVLHIDFCDQLDCSNLRGAYAYDLVEFINNAERIKSDLLHAAKKQPHSEIIVKLVKAFRDEPGPRTAEFSDYWTLQHFFAKAELKAMLATFKEYFAYVIISTPDFLTLDSSLLVVPFEDMNIHIFKAGATTRKSANLLCKLNGSEPTPIINVIDFSKQG